MPVNEMNGNKAPRPDGFTGLFYKHCWDIIREDIMKVLHTLYRLNSSKLHLLNDATLILLPKSEDATTPKELSHPHLL